MAEKGLFCGNNKPADPANMTDAEKKENPHYTSTEGYLKTFGYKEAWSNLWLTLNQEQKDSFKDLPNFNADKFKDITGIDIVDTSCLKSGQEITVIIDGKETTVIVK